MAMSIIQSDILVTEIIGKNTIERTVAERVYWEDRTYIDNDIIIDCKVYYYDEKPVQQIVGKIVFF